MSLVDERADDLVAVSDASDQKEVSKDGQGREENLLLYSVE